MHQIENNYLKITAREYGAELTSLIDKRTGTEHLWQANPQVWGWHAPLLFPVIGRCFNDEIIIDGRNYPMEKHGFARKSNFQLLELSEERIVFSLKPNAEISSFYPYKFELLVAYRLQANRLWISYEVINKDDKEIFFSVGGHPAFAVPFTENERFEDYYVEFEQNEDFLYRSYIDAQGFFDGRKEVVLANSNKLNLNANLFDDDALIFKELKSRKVYLKSKINSHSVELDFSEFQYLGLWTKPGANYLCIEPWLGCADSNSGPSELKDKEGITSLATGNRILVLNTASKSVE